MRKLPSPANDPLFVKLSPKQTIQASLNGQQVIEFPTFFICETPVDKMFRLLLTPVHGVAVENEGLLMEGCLPKDSSKKVDFQEENRQIVVEGEQGATVAVTSINLKTVELLDDPPEDPDDNDNDSDDDTGEVLKLCHKAAFNVDDSKDEEREGEGEGGAAYEEFMQALMEMSNKDINALQSFIAQAELEE